MVEGIRCRRGQSCRACSRRNGGGIVAEVDAVSEVLKEGEAGSSGPGLGGEGVMMRRKSPMAVVRLTVVGKGSCGSRKGSEGGGT